MELGKIISEIDFSDRVVCDWSCDGDYTHSDEEGGILFGSKAVCPKCAPDLIKSAKAGGESKYIRGHCPKGMSFREWVLRLRGGNNKITVREIKSLK